MNTRREFLHWTGAALGSSWLASAETEALAAAEPPLVKTGSDVGSLFPFIQSQARRSHTHTGRLEEAPPDTIYFDNLRTVSDIASPTQVICIPRPVRTDTTEMRIFGAADSGTTIRLMNRYTTTP